MIKKILIGLLVVFVLIQFIRPARNNGNAATSTDVTHYVTVPDSVMAILKTSCYDCHSNHTEYPWYVNINPVGLWLKNHIDEGKQEINFSDFSRFDKKKMLKKLDKVVTEVQHHGMPLDSYLWIHTNAKLSDAQIQTLADWVLEAKREINSKL